MLMKTFNKLYLIFILCILFSIHLCIAQTWQWGEKIDIISLWPQGPRIAVDDCGNSYVTGNGIGGSADIFLAKYDPHGNLIWIKQPEGSGIDKALEITLDESNNIYITGFFNWWISGTDSGIVIFEDDTLISKGNADIFIAKYDSDGNMLLVKQAGGKYQDQGSAISVDLLGNIIITGSFNDTIIFDNSDTLISDSSDVFVAKYDSIGNVLWVRQFGGKYYDESVGIAVDDNNNIYITGYFEDTLIFGPDTLSAFVTDDLLFLVKYNASGNEIWAKMGVGNYIGAGNTGEVKDITIDLSNNIYITGYFDDFIYFDSIQLTNFSVNANLFLFKFDTLGNVIWAKKEGGVSARVEGYGISTDDSSNIYITGNFGGTVSFGNDTLIDTTFSNIFVVKYNSAGNNIWVKQAGGEYFDSGYGIDIDKRGNAYITGIFGSFLFPGGTAVFGDDTLEVTASDWSGFIAKLGNPSLSINIINSSNVICNGDSNGYAIVTSNGGIMPYTYFWSNGDTTDSIGDLTAGTYTVIITDSLECSVTGSVTITGPTPLTASIAQISNISCFNECDGEAIVSYSGGTTPYMIAWDDSTAFSDTIITLCSSNHTVIIYDSNGCIAFDTITIIEPDSITITYTIDSANQGNNDGVIYLTVTGGTQPYTFSWSNGDTTEDLDSILAGTYIVLVTDSLGCIDSASIEVQEITGIQQFLSIITELKVYPNPNDGNFQIDYQLPEGQKGELTIFNIMGKKLFTYPLVNEMNSLKISKGSVLKNGLYFYQIVINNHIVTTEKLLIMAY
ncbi:MAG: T9SS type A sorting domain-containing protein [Cytophagales bacterium]|nr:T9SS type A sorting domain-containing protein [Cytophagales bacterium]